ncbi:hypothetical protein FB451DRAFT_1169624 [Mycena latifolia]|nr:hypothetical protein FB451DRAFT_1169624 [Mycena latifolia]
MAKSNVQCRGITLTVEEVEANQENHEGKVITTPLWVVIAHSTLIILCDDSSYMLKYYAVWIWQASRNIHCLDPQHPLTQLERCLWLLIVVLHERRNTSTLFTSEEFKAAGMIINEDTLACGGSGSGLAIQPGTNLNPPPPNPPAEPLDGADSNPPPQKGKQTAAAPWG